MLLRVYWKEKREKGLLAALGGQVVAEVRRQVLLLMLFGLISKLTYCVLGAEEEDMLYELDKERTDGNNYLLIKFFALTVGAEILKWDEADESKVLLIHQEGQVYIVLKAEWTLNEGGE